jgi:hypothetical protein
MTRTSAKGPNIRTPFKKSDIESGAEDLFFPKLIDSSLPSLSEECEGSEADQLV